MAATSEKATASASCHHVDSSVIRREAASSASAVVQDWAEDKQEKKAGMASLIRAEPSSSANTKGGPLTLSFSCRTRAEMGLYVCMVTGIRTYMHIHLKI